MSRSGYKILPNDTNPYFLTSTTVNWLPLFSDHNVANYVFEVLMYLRAEGDLTIHAYVLMENHLHLVAASDQLVKTITRFKSYSARRCIDYYKAQGNQFILEQLAYHKEKQRTDRRYQFWQAGVHPKRIHDEAMMVQKIEYIHHNPVRRGYVDEPEHWRYSSAKNYAKMGGLLEVCMDW
jgi:REP element-mobilizing transposase RayT